MIPDDLASKLLMAARLNQMFGSPSMNEDDDVNNYYKPRTNISQQYQKSLSEMPRRTPPTRMGRILGAIAGLGAGAGAQGMYEGQPIGFSYNPRTAEEAYSNIADKPYREKLQDWSLRNEALGKGAAEEDRYNTNQRLLANSIVTRKQNAQKAEETRRHNEELEADRQTLRARQQQDADTRKANSAINKWKAEHPSHKIMVAGDRLVAVDPLTNKTEYLKDENGYAIDSGKLDDMTKLYIGLGNQLAEIHARGTEERTTVGTRGAEERKTVDERGVQERQNIGARGVENRKTDAERPVRTTTAGDTETTTEQRDAKGNLISTTKRRTTRGNNLGGQPSPTGTVNPAQDAKRQQAIDILTKAGKVVNEQTIKMVMDRMK